MILSIEKLISYKFIFIYLKILIYLCILFLFHFHLVFHVLNLYITCLLHFYILILLKSLLVLKTCFHFDESSPHLHIVGIAVKDNCKTGMSKQVGKCSVFAKDKLPKIQDKMRDKCIQSFNKEYGLNAVLKDKQKGRNIDYRVSQMADFDELKKNYNKQRQKINKLLFHSYFTDIGKANPIITQTGPSCILH